MPNPSAESPEQTSADNDQRQGTFIAGGEFHSQVVGYQAIYTEEQAYNVAGLPNPYLGLRAFTATDRDIFAGRERMVQALVERLSADDGDRLLFLVGASGSGKSSLARAGLLPALEARLRELDQAVEIHIFDRPGHALATSLKHLLRDTNPASTLLLDLLSRVPQNRTPHSSTRFQPKIQLLLLDQFEELWSQTGSDEAEQTLNLLLKLATQHDKPLRIVATLRSDFLPQLVADARFEPYERRKVVVRAMSVNELADAIQQPARVRHPSKRLEPTLVERLAQDAAQDAAYLPLLQVTLEDLWYGGNMRLAAYRGLADAIQRRAETVYIYRDYGGLQQEERPVAERETMLSLLLDLVRVSPGEEQRETRWRRTRTELIGNDPQRARLIDDLTAARLLRTDHEIERDSGQERSIETVDLVHEALLRNWPRLYEAIEAERENLRRRERFLLALNEWRNQQCHDDYLLQNVRLAEAEAIWRRDDTVFYDPDALKFYQRSVHWRDHERYRQVRRARTITTGFGVLALLALLAAGMAITEQRRAEHQLNIAESRRLAVETASLLAGNGPEQALLLAIEGAHLDANPTMWQVLQQAVIRRRHKLQTFSNHIGIVYGAIFSPDGKRILTASEDGTARLWNTDGSLLVSFQGHTGAVYSAIFSPDGKRILTASEDGTARLWNTDGSLLVSFQGHTGAVYSAIFSPDGKRILTASEDGTARLWNTDGTPIVTLQRHMGIVWSAVFSPDGNRILTASEDGTARLWNTDGSLLVTFQGHTARVRAIFSPNGSSILTISWDGTARLWNLDGIPITTFQGHTDALYSAVFSPDGNCIVTASEDGTARLWNIDGSTLTILQGHTDAVYSAVFSPDGNRIMTTSKDATVRLWNTDATPLATLLGHVDIVRGAVFSPEGNYILTASHDGTTQLWNADATPLTTFQGHTSDVMSAVFSSDNKRILTASWDGTARLWSTDGTPLTTLQGHTNAVVNAVFSPDNNHILTASWDGTARLWDTEGTPLATLQGHTLRVVSAVFSLDGKRILTTSWDGTARLWDTKGIPLATLQCHTLAVYSAVFSPDGDRILTASDDGTARLWDTDGILLATFQGHTGAVLSAVFSPNGNRIVTASDDRTARLWDTEGATLAILQGHTGAVLSAVFSPDGNRIVTTSDDRTVRLWNADGTTLVTFQGHTSPVLSAVFSSDGKRIVTTSSDNTARLWPVELSDWLLAAKCRVSRTLTDQEVRDYQVPTPLAFDDTAFAQRQCPPVYSWER